MYTSKKYKLGFQLYRFWVKFHHRVEAWELNRVFCYCSAGAGFSSVLPLAMKLSSNLFYKENLRFNSISLHNNCEDLWAATTIGVQVIVNPNSRPKRMSRNTINLLATKMCPQRTQVLFCKRNFHPAVIICLSVRLNKIAIGYCTFYL